MSELTEERLAEFERHAQSESVAPSEVLELVAAFRQMENNRDEARGLAREYLYALWEEDSEQVRKAAREKEAEFHPWLLEPEPATATGVAEAVFGMTQFEE